MTAMSLELGQDADHGGRLATTENADEPAISDGMDEPLVGDAAGLRANWQRIQAGFVDDPREAVADAADLIEHAAQVLVGALQQRQRRLRGMWDGRSTQETTTSLADSGPGIGSGPQGGTSAQVGTGPLDAGGSQDRSSLPDAADANGGGRATSGGGGADTEHLRLMMQRYRSLFNQICGS
jgi:hypothetical protein